MRQNACSIKFRKKKKWELITRIPFRRRQNARESVDCAGSRLAVVAVSELIAGQHQNVFFLFRKSQLSSGQSGRFQLPFGNDELPAEHPRVFLFSCDPIQCHLRSHIFVQWSIWVMRNDLLTKALSLTHRFQWAVPMQQLEYGHQFLEFQHCSSFVRFQHESGRWAISEIIHRSRWEGLYGAHLNAPIPVSGPSPSWLSVLNDDRASWTAFIINSSLMRRDGCSLNIEFMSAILAELRRASAFVGQFCECIKIIDTILGESNRFEWTATHL